MGNYASAVLFFGVTKWVPPEIADEIDKRGGTDDYVVIEQVSAGDETIGYDEILVAAYWKGSKIEQQIDYDTAFTMSRFNEIEIGKKIVTAWKEMGFEIQKPRWHMISSYG